MHTRACQPGTGAFELLSGSQPPGTASCGCKSGATSWLMRSCTVKLASCQQPSTKSGCSAEPLGAGCRVCFCLLLTLCVTMPQGVCVRAVALTAGSLLQLRGA
jgi:hypothetical protein